MKILTVLLMALTASALHAQTPDPRDSIIVESKGVTPLNGACASAPLRIRAWITNKDTLAAVNFRLETRSGSDGAYATLSHRANCNSTRIFSDAITPLFSYELKSRLVNTAAYHSNSPDTFSVFFQLSDPGMEEEMYSNFFRLPFLEIKFDSVFSDVGRILIDSSSTTQYADPWDRVGFFDFLTFKFVPVNFVKGIITVANKGDMNQG